MVKRLMKVGVTYHPLPWGFGKCYLSRGRSVMETYAYRSYLHISQLHKDHGGSDTVYECILMLHGVRKPFS